MKTLLISGGLTGIGKSIVETFLHNNYKVISISRKSNMTLKHKFFEHFQLDISDYSKCEIFVEYLKIENIKIDVLINNAGITNDSFLHKMSKESWDSVININLNGTFYLTKLLSNQLLDNENASIINISSIVASYGNIGQSNYVASKAAIEGLTKVWAKELALKNINLRVNCISPGFIDTEMIRKVPKDILKSITEKVTLKRLGKPEEVAKLALFLASDDASYITGQIIHINGGLVL